MSISQTTPEETTSVQRFCPQCNATLPRRATFCSSCGKRLEGKKQIPGASEEEDIHQRYRITTLVRRRPFVTLYFALDNRQGLQPGQSRTVALRDIEIGQLKKEKQAEAIALVQREYDQLRQWQIPHLLTCIDLRILPEHLFLVSGLPLVPQEGTPVRSTQRLYTLQDFLQSGQGLPKEARTLEWMRKLLQAVEGLHQRNIVLGDLDPYTVILNRNSTAAEPKLMVSWLLPELRTLLPEAGNAPQVSYFSAPEAIQGKPTVRSDVYSLGALLYLLLTGNPPDESTLRNRRRLRSPREINFRISQYVDECAMQALSLDPQERFASVGEMLKALNNVHFRQTPRPKAQPSQTPPPPAGEDHTSEDAETVRIVPLSQKDVARWRAAHQEKLEIDKSLQSTQQMPVMDRVSAPASTPLPPPPAPPASGSERKTALEPLATLPSTPPPGQAASSLSGRLKKSSSERHTLPPTPAVQKTAWRERITGILPVLKAETSVSGEQSATVTSTKQTAKTKRATTPRSRQESDLSLLKLLQRLILGQQQHAVEAAAIIETPLRIRPDQPYNLRMHIMGREEAGVFPRETRVKEGQQGGLSSLTHGDAIKIEVRSVLQQGYTYILQQASVTIPASGYAAEVTIPMQPQPGGGSGRRDRLHVFFLDEQRNPLYEKPFVVEVFVSPLVQFGREGYQVLTIPL